MMVVINWQYDTNKFLVEHGANLIIYDKFGRSAIEKAGLRGLNSILKYPKQQNDVRLEKKIAKFEIEFDFLGKLKDSCEWLTNSFRY